MASMNGRVRRSGANRYGFIRGPADSCSSPACNETWYSKRDQLEVTFTIVTCAANTLIGEIHDRMPMILDERAAEDWMNPQEKDPLSLKRLLVPVPCDLLFMQPASPLVNSVKNEGPERFTCNVTPRPSASSD